MTTLPEQSLEFAKTHISKFYDSDFFPKPREFEALWHNWGDVKKELTSKNIEKLWVTSPRSFPVPKPSGEFRVVHQLQPLDALIYTAMAHQIADPVAAARMPLADRAARAYYYTILNSLDPTSVPESVLGNIDDELDDIAEALNSTTAHRRMAQTYLLRNETGKARASLDRAATTCPGYRYMPDLASL